MDSCGAISQSMTNINSNHGPHSSSTDDPDDSFIILDRVTAVDFERIESEAVLSLRSLNLGTEALSNHFSEVHRREEVPYSVEPSGELTSSTHLSGSFSLPSDVHQRMESLVQEKISLQVTLDQTNVALRQMMMTLDQWRSAAEKQRQDHRENFQETRAFVMKLKKEKAEMRAEIEELKSRAKPAEISPNENELKAVIEDLKLKLNASIEAHKAEVEKSKAVMEELTFMKEKMQKVTEQADSFEAHKDSENQKLLNEISLLRQENNILKNDLGNLSSVERHSQDYQMAQAKGFTLRIDELTAKLLVTEEQLRKANDRIKLLEEFSNSDEDQQSSAALSNAEATVNRLRSRVDEMTAIIVDLQQKVDSQAKEIHDLHEENTRTVRVKDEALGILQAQVEVYQSDFNAERQCREQLAGEKEQLAEDLRRMHRRCLNLQEELHKMGNQDPPSIEVHGLINQTEQSQEPTERPTTSSFTCPMCQLSFRSLQLVNEHLDQCLDNGNF